MSNMGPSPVIRVMQLAILPLLLTSAPFVTELRPSAALPLRAQAKRGHRPAQPIGGGSCALGGAWGEWPSPAGHCPAVRCSEAGAPSLEG